MRNINCSSLYCLFFFLSIVVVFIPAALTLQCLKDEKSLLLELKSELIFDSNYSTKLVRWNESAADPDSCEWEGVTCDDAGHVIRLQLGSEFISGGFNESSTLFCLRYLEELNLRNNSLSGSIPSTIFALLPSLKQLDLSSNQFSGQMNEFLPLPIFSNNLQYIYLDDNLLSGSIPHSFFALPSLKVLRLSNNQFSVFPHQLTAVNISILEELRLDGNRLEGPIPNSFSLLKSLEWIDLSYNLFNGTFQLENLINPGLPNLTQLDLSYNNLNLSTNINSSTLLGFPNNLLVLGLASCNLTNFPDFLKQTSLNMLDLSKNQIAGDIPSWIWEIGNGTLWSLNLSFNYLLNLQRPYHIPASLSSLDLHSNHLSGELPPLPKSVDYVDYSSNQFDSPSLSTLFRNTTNQLHRLFFLSLANNNLSGAIPTSICGCYQINILDLSFNNFNSTIPPCLPQSLERLQVLNLRGNKNIHGAVPDQFPVDCILRTLDLSNNSLGNKIPRSLANCKSLTVLNVGYNNFDDTFPCMLPSSLRVLVLRSNRFHGGLGSSSPCTSTTHMKSSWSSNLQIVDISSNNFNGSLHGLELSNWRGMMMLQNGTHVRSNRSASDTLSLGSNLYRDEVRLTVKGIEVNLVKIWPEFTSIDLSCNNFQGGIPDALGNLTSLYLLNLSHNALTSTIPKSLGAMTELGSLDVSVNHLRGRIPEELAGLTFLSILNVSYNELVGTIPKGTQFQTFSEDWFEGNAGLCGFPLNTSCSGSDGNHDSTPPKVEKEEEEIEWGYVCAAVGYGVGLGSIAWIMLFWRGFRERYFHKIEEVAEKILDSRDMRRKRRRRKHSEVRRRLQ